MNYYENEKLSAIMIPNSVVVSYTYDKVGNILTILDARNSNQKQCFTYDTLNRLTKATTNNDAAKGCTTSVGNGNYNETYSYANNGNLSNKSNLGNYTYGSGSVSEAACTLSPVSATAGALAMMPMGSACMPQ